MKMMFTSSCGFRLTCRNASSSDPVEIDTKSSFNWSVISRHWYSRPSHRSRWNESGSFRYDFPSLGHPVKSNSDNGTVNWDMRRLDVSRDKRNCLNWDGRFLNYQQSGAIRGHNGSDEKYVWYRTGSNNWQIQIKQFDLPIDSPESTPVPIFKGLSQYPKVYPKFIFLTHGTCIGNMDSDTRRNSGSEMRPWRYNERSLTRDMKALILGHWILGQ